MKRSQKLQKQTLSLLDESMSTLLKEAESLSPLAKLLLCTQFYSLYAERSPASFNLNSSIFANPRPVLGQEERQETIAIIRDLLMILSDLIKKSEFDSNETPLALAVGYWSTLYGALMTRKYSADLPLLEPLDLISALCVGWGPHALKSIKRMKSPPHG